jgi:hypothetical protein
MGQGRHHGERAFEAFLRARRTPYVSVNEARRALIAGGEGCSDLKSFDFVVYSGGGAGGANLLVDIKCRRLPVATSSRLALVTADGVRRPARSLPRRPRLENWTTREDIRSLRAWQGLFGTGFKSAFLFVYWSDAQGDGDQISGQPPDGLFDEVFHFENRWYAVRGVLLDDYEPAMQERSARWRTVDLPPVLFERLSDGFGRRWLGGNGLQAVPDLPKRAAGR